MIRVLQVFTILNRGGAETNIMNYYRNIDRSKIQFDFLVHREEVGEYEKEIIELGGTIYRLPSLNLCNLYRYRKAIKDFFKNNTNYQIIHGNLSELGYFIYAEAKKRKVPVIIAHAHSSTMTLDRKTLFRYLLKIGIRKNINTYFTCGYDSSVYLFGQKKAALAVQINNAIDVQKFAYRPSDNQKIRAQFGSSDLKIVHVGSFNPIKNHKYIIEIFKEVNNIQPSSHLYLIGEGDLKKETIDIVNDIGLRDKVSFLGSRSDVTEILQSMDVFLFPSLFEGLPVSLVEAQASGIQCVISDGIPQEAILVPENVTVISLKQNAKYWAEEITKLKFNLRKDVSEIIIQKGYDIKENARKLEEKYTELVKNAANNNIQP